MHQPKMSGNQEILHEARGIVVIIDSIWFETCNISKILTHIKSYCEICGDRESR